jgi:tetratricopeptide (TPR) repeat protein
LLGAAAAAAILVMVLAGVRGSDSVVSLAGEWKVERGDAIARGTPVMIPDGGKAKLLLADGTEIWAGPGTRMSLEGEAGSRLRLEAGHVVADVRPRGEGARFEMVTPDAKVLVLGTLFSVRVAGDRTVVKLHRGRLRLDCQERVVAMEAGHEVIAGPAGLVSMGTFEEAAAGEDLALAMQRVSSRPGERDCAEPAPAARVEPMDAAATGNREVSTAEPRVAPADTAGQPAAAPEKADASGAPGAELAAVRDLWNAGGYAQILDSTKGVGLDPELLYFRAKALAATGSWQEAGEAFGAVAGMSRPLRPEALYLSARAYSRAGAFERSLDMAELAISVGGPNADHAWRLKLGALSGMGRYVDASEQAARYIAVYPAGAHIGEAHFVRATGLRVSKMWSDAAAAYGQFLDKGKGSPAMMDDAEFFLGYCKTKAGRAGEGRLDLERYLASHPQGKHSEQARAALAP